ncbi:MAG: transporter [Verrucomicrobiales bacterium]|nr:transporter [Verrucomicrobiales bacterium]
MTLDNPGVEQVVLANSAAGGYEHGPSRTWLPGLSRGGLPLFRPMMINVQNLTKRFSGRTAVDGISFQVQPGEIVGFLGPNGAGKSTTMRMLTGYLPPTSGSASISGHDVFNDSLKARREIGFMPENVPLYEDMRVAEYLSFRAALKGVKIREVRSHVERAMEYCGLTEVKKKMIGTLSKGFRQRVGLADALVHKPRLLILDEPTNGLDPNQIRQVRSLITQLAGEHTILLSTHILSEVQMSCRRVIIINKGTIRADDTPDALANNLQSSGTVSVELKAAPAEAEEKLTALEHVRRLSSSDAGGGWHRYELRVEPGGDVRVDISELARARQWSLRELTQHNATLEDVFVELTQRD